MTSEIQMNSSSLQSLLIILVIICAISYAYLEFRKINTRLEILENKESRTEQMFLELKESLQKDNFKSSLMGDDNETETVNNEDIDENFNENFNENVNEEIQENTNDAINEDDIQMDSVSQTEEIQEQQLNQEEVYEQPTVMSFSFLSTMNHVETPTNENNIEDITEEKEIEEVIDETVIDETTDLVVDDSETKIIKTDKYDHCTVKELKDILTEQDLPTSGNKTKLIQRIIENTE